MNTIKPHWPAPQNIHAFTTTRCGGVSKIPYDSLNLGSHVQDNIKHVIKNREILVEKMHLPKQPAWLNQTHSSTVVCIDDAIEIGDADAGYSNQANHVCAVMTADCLPLLVCNKQGNKVAAIHAGWKGLATGIIEATIAKLQSKPEDLLVWLAPAIGPNAFEVGYDVYSIFTEYDSQAESCFISVSPQKWLLNIYLAATQRLNACGIRKIYGGEHCTYSETNRFFSYRRDGVTGRMASIIWFE